MHLHDLNDPDLNQLLTAHADVLAPLLGPLWPVEHVFERKQYGPLTKYTLAPMPDGRWAMLHRLAGIDHAPPHSHPCRMDSYGIDGEYWELSYHEDSRTELTLRAAGGHYTIWPETVHKAVGIPSGVAWTLVFSGPVVNEAKHYPELEAAA